MTYLGRIGLVLSSHKFTSYFFFLSSLLVCRKDMLLPLVSGLLVFQPSVFFFSFSFYFIEAAYDLLLAV